MSSKLITARLKSFPPEQSQVLLGSAEEAFAKVGTLIEQCKFRAALREVIAVAENGNRYFHEKEPWVKIKDEKKRDEVEHDLAVVLHLIKSLSTLIYPFLPRTAKNIDDIFGILTEKNSWGYVQPSVKQSVGTVTPLFKKIDDDQIAQELEKLGSS